MVNSLVMTFTALVSTLVWLALYLMAMDFRRTYQYPHWAPLHVGVVNIVLNGMDFRRTYPKPRPPVEQRVQW